jgi:alginate O-acetyltransferase complex protein AlgI
LPVNFAAPFRAQSIIELWRRWHMSLSRFLRDFVYIPLGGSHCGPARQAFNVFITMVLGGLWHGAGWTFITWGAFMGALLVVNHRWRVRRGDVRRGHLQALAGWAATLTAFATGMVFFRSADMTAASGLLTSMAGFGDAPVPDRLVIQWDDWVVRHGYFSDDLDRRWFGATWSLIGTFWTVGALAMAVVVPDTMEIVHYAEGGNKIFMRPVPWLFTWQPTLRWLALTFAVVALALAKSAQVKEFLYYQF